ncbi:hypothetical protein GCM10007859_25060 [Brevundimonas denitrificans]|uniref:Uncharacterized protein n=1 Tax=Brevundimonas denitrificans TaxID=1443434 RepID=A0ABQ6BQI2_9CAUL|nr:hypothetical protein GCM10007859_25060 [Brevundimonas denitrificans]
MPGKASHTIRVHRGFSIMGAPGLCRGAHGRPHDRRGLLMKLVETPDLVRGALDLQATRGGVRGGDSGPGLGRL